MILQEMNKTDLEWLAEQDADFRQKGKIHYLRKIVIIDELEMREFNITENTGVKLYFEDV